MDKYDKEIAYLMLHPDEVFAHWRDGTELFQFAAGDDWRCHIGASVEIGGPATGVGCLTMVRSGRFCAYNAKGEMDLVLTELIRADTRIPDTGAVLTLEHLPVFAEWQRRLDVLCERSTAKKTAKSKIVQTMVNPGQDEIAFSRTRV